MCACVQYKPLCMGPPTHQPYQLKPIETATATKTAEASSAGAPRRHSRGGRLRGLTQQLTQAGHGVTGHPFASRRYWLRRQGPWSGCRLPAFDTWWWGKLAATHFWRHLAASLQYTHIYAPTRWLAAAAWASWRHIGPFNERGTSSWAPHQANPSPLPRASWCYQRARPPPLRASGGGTGVRPPARIAGGRRVAALLSIGQPNHPLLRPDILRWRGQLHLSLSPSEDWPPVRLASQPDARRPPCAVAGGPMRVVAVRHPTPSSEAQPRRAQPLGLRDGSPAVTAIPQCKALEADASLRPISGSAAQRRASGAKRRQ